MEITDNGLKKPSQDDFYNVDDFNDNTEILEEHLNDKEKHINAKQIVEYPIAEKLEEVTEEDNVKTLWGKLKKIIVDFLEHINTVATSSALGHVKVTIGNGLSNSSGKISMSKATASTYGATQLANNITTSSSGAYALDAYQGKVLAGNISANSTNIATNKTNITTKAPILHASTASTYGVGNVSNYGHVKLSDTYATKVSNGAAANGVAVSQNALYNAYNQLNSNLTQVQFHTCGIKNITLDRYCEQIGLPTVNVIGKFTIGHFSQIMADNTSICFGYNRDEYLLKGLPVMYATARITKHNSWRVL